MLKKWKFSRESPKAKAKEDLQRLSPGGRVKPQAKGGRKMLQPVKVEEIVCAEWKHSEVHKRTGVKLRITLNKINIYKLERKTFYSEVQNLLKSAR
jgi:hypothetical protein